MSADYCWNNKGERDVQIDISYIYRYVRSEYQLILVYWMTIMVMVITMMTMMMMIIIIIIIINIEECLGPNIM
jgi:hypothetical protein